MHREKSQSTSLSPIDQLHKQEIHLHPHAHSREESPLAPTCFHQRYQPQVKEQNHKRTQNSLLLAVPILQQTEPPEYTPHSPVFEYTRIHSNTLEYTRIHSPLSSLLPITRHPACTFTPTRTPQQSAARSAWLGNRAEFSGHCLEKQIKQF